MKLSDEIIKENFRNKKILNYQNGIYVPLVSKIKSEKENYQNSSINYLKNNINYQKKSIWDSSKEEWDENINYWKAVGCSTERGVKNNNLYFSRSEKEFDLIENLSFKKDLIAEKIFTYCILFDSNRTVLGVSNIPYKINQFVIIEADRGEDCGEIISSNIIDKNLVKNKDFDEKFTNLLENNYKDKFFLNAWKGFIEKPIRRLASSKDIEKITEKRKKELLAINYINHIKGVYDCEMEIIKCEYQWDDNKITFYYTSPNRVDFRNLVQEAFKHFKIRIWMCNVNRGI